VTKDHNIKNNNFASESPPAYTVYAGSVDLEGDGEHHQVAEFVVHEGYNSSDYDLNDIALVRVRTDFFDLNINLRYFLGGRPVHFHGQRQGREPDQSEPGHGAGKLGHGRRMGTPLRKFALLTPLVLVELTPKTL